MKEDELRDLLGKATTKPLTPDQEKQALQILNADCLNNVGFRPEDLPSLVENNPKVAFEALLNLMESENITE